MHMHDIHIRTHVLDICLVIDDNSGTSFFLYIALIYVYNVHFHVSCFSMHVLKKHLQIRVSSGKSCVDSCISVRGWGAMEGCSAGA